MDNATLIDRSERLSSATVADACVLLGVAFSIAPPSVMPLAPVKKMIGRALPCVHSGSVDVFFESMERASRGDVLVIDNEDRRDEGCIGDLTVAEAIAYGMAGMVVWGAHRDTAELRELALPVFSTGRSPAGPRGVRPSRGERCHIGAVEVTSGDVVFGDDDGVLFVPLARIENVLDAAKEIARRESAQRAELARGMTLHQQLRWDEYTAKKRVDASYTFREHLKVLQRAIET